VDRKVGHQLRILLLFSFIVPLASLVAAEQEPAVTLVIVETARAASFSPLLWIDIKNDSYTPLNLIDRFASAGLFIDGQLSKIASPFRGPPGLPAMGHWQGCLAGDEFSPPITPGKHRLSLKLGNAQSETVTVKWPAPMDWRQGNLKSREKEVRDMAAQLRDGLPRNCVEQWLTVKDGGVQDAKQVRYYLDPFLKVVVPYSAGDGLGLEGETVSGEVKVYEEPRLKD